MKKHLTLFFVRWALNSLGLWMAIRLLGTGYDDRVATAGFWGFIVAGFVFSLFNSLLKPLLVVVSFPVILVTLGLFTLIVNGVLVYISLILAPGIPMSFGNSIITGIILSLINYIVSAAFEFRRSTRSVR